MKSDEPRLATNDKSSDLSANATQLPPRVWPALLLVVAFWTFLVVARNLELPIFVGFFSLVIACAVLTLLFLVWWLTNGRIRAAERLLGVGALVGSGVAAGWLCDPSVGPAGLLMFGLPAVFTAWALWYAVARKRPAAVRQRGLFVAMAVTWAAFLVVRMNGIDGDQNADIHWRWTPTAEDLFLADRANAADVSRVAGNQVDSAVTLQSGDWPDFRGPGRDGVLRGVEIATDWSASPPRQVWRQRVGPAWSSVIVLGERLFTQEQRGEAEAVVALDAATGREIWAHSDSVRFFDGQAGAGPRSTPVFADGNIFSLGATGILNCLDAAKGEIKWSRNIVTDSGAPLPMWGFSSSPLVVDGVVVVFAGGENEKGLLAYRAATGEPLWTAATGQISYSSPQLVAVDGENQVLFFSDRGLIAVEPATGAARWQHEANRTGIWRAVQPRSLADGQVLIGSEDLGLVLLDVARRDNAWSATERWSSKAMRPAYNDLVTSDGFAYGFDGAIFCCVDLQTGKRCWKAGRYGHGQVLLLADQHLLLVLSENGSAVLVAANPERHEELGRFQAVEGKTWNHPVIAHGRLYARNDAEMACYELKPAVSQ